MDKDNPLGKRHIPDDPQAFDPLGKQLDLIREQVEKEHPDWTWEQKAELIQKRLIEAMKPKL